MNTIYLRRRKRVHVSVGTEVLPVSLVATIQKNLRSLGFILSPELIARLQTISQPELETFYRNLVRDLQVMTGAHREFRPFYPNFPAQVMKMSEASLYLNAFIHYWTHQRPISLKLERPPLDAWNECRVIELGTKEDFESIFTTLAQAKSSLSAEDKTDLAWFVAQYRDEISRLLPQEIPFKENLALLAAELIRHTSFAESYLQSRVKGATDVLRIAVAMNGGDVSLAEPCKFKSFRRSERRLFLSWLERSSDLNTDLQRWGERWKRLGEKLHPGEYADRFPKTFASFTNVRRDLPSQTFQSRIEQRLTARDTIGALGLLRARPGDLARRLDHLVRLSDDATEVVETFRASAAEVSTPVLLQLLTHFAHRGLARPLRAFFPKGDVGKVYAQPNSLPELPAGVADSFVEICESVLVARFAQMPRLGRCYLDSTLKNYLVPFSQRSAGKSLKTLVRGSRIPLPAGDFVRLFLWWKNGESRTDIDLSAAIYGPDFRYVSVLSYYQLKDFGGCHSGDIVDAPEGAAEFIDLDLEKLAERNVGYVVMSINSYTSQPYCDLPECFAGWMMRKSADSGEIFDARTVLDKVDIAAATKICLPLVLDLAKREVVWGDIALRDRPRWNNVHQNLGGVSLMLRALTGLVKTDLATLFALHIRARGEMVSDPAEADTIFAVDSGITPFDLDLIRSDFL